MAFDLDGVLIGLGCEVVDSNLIPARLSGEITSVGVLNQAELALDH